MTGGGAHAILDDARLSAVIACVLLTADDAVAAALSRCCCSICGLVVVTVLFDGLRSACTAESGQHDHEQQPVRLRD
jgi:hypothetical protein